MITVTNIPNCPPLAGDYMIRGEHQCRVTITRSGSRDGYVSYHAQAWLMDAMGGFIVDADGAPIRAPGSDHTINLSALAARTATRDPGWIKHTSADVDPDALPSSWRVGDGLPTDDGDDPIGACYYDRQAQQAWIFSGGELDRIRRGKVEELAHILTLRELGDL